MKECGNCALCCKLLNVPGVCDQGTQCRYADTTRNGGACRIYNGRPKVCSGYNCFWRAESWPESLRPDRCNVIFEALPGVKTVLVSVEPSQPDAWKKNEIMKVIEILVKKGRPLVLKTKNDSMMFIPDGMNKEEVLQDIKQVLDWQRGQQWQPQHTQQI